jgi:aspartate 1-decarboxylase
MFPVSSVPVSPNRWMLKSKIHRATVTHADQDYEGSLTLDKSLLEAADIIPYEAVYIWNVTRGTRFHTYAMEADPGSGVVCINGAAAHLAGPGDVVIIATFSWLDEDAARRHVPRVVLMGPGNVIARLKHSERPGPYHGPGEGP